MTNRIAYLLCALAAALIAAGVSIGIEPTCLEVASRYDGMWTQTLRNLPYPVRPSWAVDVVELKCRDGVLRVWSGEPPPFRTGMPK